MQKHSPDSRVFKDHIFGHFARVGAALGNAKRVELIDVLLQGERTVESLAGQVSAAVATTSRHLQILAAAGLVVRRAEGNQRFYRVSGPDVSRAYLALTSLAEGQIEEITTLAEAFFGQVDGTRAVSLAEFDELRRSGDVVLVDVRPASEFRAGHAEGAVNIPVSELDARLAELPPEAEIVAYCRGPYCVMAAHAIALLRREGFSAVRLAEGYPEWRELGRPIGGSAPESADAE